MTPKPDTADSQHRPQVVFFGSGPVAARSLELLQQWCDIEAVITKPQPPHHKEPFPVIQTAQQHELKILTASNRRELDELMGGEHFTSQVAVLIDYGIIVSQAVIDSFPLGIVNSHFSLLPEWRGADPITFSILSGQQETGISLMLLVQAMDEGPLLGQATYALPNDITTPELTQDLIDLSDHALREILPQYLAGTVQPAPQRQVTLPSHDQPSYSRKLTKADGLLDFNKPANELEREVRAFADWPKSRTVLAGKDIVVVSATASATPAEYAAEPTGTAFTTGDKRIGIVCSQDTLWIEQLKPAGKPVMDSRAFLAGNTL